MYCTNCGKWNLEESKFCGYCGKPLIKERGTVSRYKDNIMNGEGLKVSYLKTVLLCIALMWLTTTSLHLWFTGTTERLYYSLAQFIWSIITNPEISFSKGIQEVAEYLGGQSLVGKTIFTLDWSFSIIEGMLVLLAIWRIFKKADRHGWECLIPIYNVFCALIIIFGDKWGTYLLLYLLFMAIIFFVPTCLGVNALTSIIIYTISLAIVFKLSITISRRFGHGWGYAILQAIIPPLFVLIYGWGKDQYHGEIEGL